jgi:phosphatidylinositol glycan class K
MELKGRYKEILFIIDTCQASTLAVSITSPGITTIGSSGKGLILTIYLP